MHRLLVVILAACGRFNFDELVDDDLSYRDANLGAPDGPLCMTPGADWADWAMPNDPGSGRPNPSSYTVTANTVHDNVSGLVWQRAVAPSMYTWGEAWDYCSSLAVNDTCWRLPHRVELASIVNYSIANPSIDSSFPSTPADQFWSFTVAAGSPNEAWTINFSAGHADYVPQTELHNVRCVQVTPPPPANRYQANAGTVLDVPTGLEWERVLDPGSYDFAQAAAYCAGLALAGGGWREPSIQELETLVDTSRTNVLIDTNAFPNTPGALFWSSSDLVTNVTMGWSLDFAFGYAYRPQTAGLRVRCVRP